MYSKFVKVVEYDEDDIWMFTRLKNLMKKNLQVVFDKSNSKESWFIAQQEAKEKTGLELSQIQYLVTDKNYNYDIYIYNIERFKSRYMEPLKAGSWKYYSWKRFKKIAW